MVTLTEGRHTAEFILSEAAGMRSRDAVTILTGEDLAAGSVLGKVNTGTAEATAYAGNTGNGAMGTITVTGRAKPGIYALTIIEPASNAGTFIVQDPGGVFVGQGDVAAAFSAGGLAFTLADGGTDFASGDGFTIAVTVSASKYKLYDPDNTDGSEKAAAILIGAIDATDADTPGAAITRDCTVNAKVLTWFTGATDGEKATGLAQLAAAGIIGR